MELQWEPRSLHFYIYCLKTTNVIFLANLLNNKTRHAGRRLIGRFENGNGEAKNKKLLNLYS